MHRRSGAWREFALGRFEAEADALAMDGDVTTKFLGADVSRDRWLAGIAVSFSSGDGTFAAIEGDDAGTVETSLTSVYPYVRLSLSERVDAYGLAGMGSGEFTMMRRDIDDASSYMASQGKGEPVHEWVVSQIKMLRAVYAS